jgi:hypothetical protein
MTKETVAMKAAFIEIAYMSFRGPKGRRILALMPLVNRNMPQGCQAISP